MSTTDSSTPGESIFEIVSSRLCSCFSRSGFYDITNEITWEEQEQIGKVKEKGTQKSTSTHESTVEEQEQEGKGKKEGTQTSASYLQTPNATLKVLPSNIDKKEEEAVKKEKQLQQEKGENTNQWNDNERELKQLRQENGDFENDERAREQELNQLRQKISVLEDEKRDREEKFKELQQEKSDLENDKSDRELKLNQLQQEKDVLEKDKMDREDELKQLRQEKSDSENDKRDKEQELKQLQQEKSDLENDKRNREHDLKQLRQEKRDLEKEKEEALFRLSELVSVKLRDNNPNIVDLSDSFRPTKLAEMFSELYDNEWTAVYSVMEESGFTERQVIDVLLDVMMESFTFCRRELDENWQLISRWYLNDKLPNNEKVKKNLKDARKTIIPNVVPEIHKKFYALLVETCKYKKLCPMLSTNEFETYVSTCILLSLLMNGNDPPVVLYCPGWVSCDQRKKEQEDESVGINEKQTAFSDEIPTEFKEVKDNVTLAKDRETRQFSKDLFKAYTKRGNLVEFYVWPVIYLHENGPLLAKGIAQGTKDKIDINRLEWWKESAHDSNDEEQATYVYGSMFKRLRSRLCSCFSCSRSYDITHGNTWEEHYKEMAKEESTYMSTSNLTKPNYRFKQLQTKRNIAEEEEIKNLENHSEKGKELQQEKGNSEHDKKDNEHALKQLQEEKRDSEHDKRDNEHALKQLQEEKRDSEHDKSDKEHELKHLQQEKRDPEHDRSDKEHELKHLQQEKRDSEDDKRDKEHELKHLQQEKKDSEHDKSDKEHELKHLQQEKRDSEHDKSDKEHKLKHLQQEKRDSEHDRSDKEHELKHLQQEKRDSEDDKRDKEHELKDLQQEKRDSEDDKRDQEHELKHLQQEKRDSEHDKSDKEDELKHFEQENIDSEHGKRDQEHELKHWQHEIRFSEHDKRDKEHELKHLQEEKRDLEIEKEKTPSSELVAVKLPDNKANIVELSDANRPTKLAEMFSELYENEWTDVNTVIKKSGFTERQIIDVLLDMLMEAFTFCRRELDESWHRLPSNEMVKRTSNDERKTTIPIFVPEIQTQFYNLLEEKCKNKKLCPILSTHEFKQYVSKCIRLSMFMNGNDPPVVLSCPGWVSFDQRRETREDFLVGINDKNIAYSDESSNDFQEEHVNFTVVEDRVTLPFRNDLFKNYTQRGAFVEFYVWPVVYLHENGGPLLAKGIAQGTEETINIDDRWKWWQESDR
ncbi:interaptin-like [Mya arenaria]|uniref:interaptin-like n=1 Tax=Mya arenaria TaxID=6604 RepID=UPI0022E6223E|nr:interaptin-like [Mya arenaria]